MMQRIWFLGCLSLSMIVGVASVQAQAVVPDGTLNTIVTRSGNSFAIDNGTTSGTNLFHSFREFSIPTGGNAIFNNAADIQNIFGRVTGGTVSNIDGMIRAQGSANLFLLNPSGILFGANASLNIGGSFVGTTAQSIRFADGMEFSATNLNDRPLLTMSAPIGLQMGQTPGTIVNQAKGATGFQGYPVGLRVSRGQMLALIGGDVSIDGGGLQATEGAIAIGSVGANQRVTLNPKSIGWEFDYSKVSSFRDILVQRAMLDGNGNGAGSIDLVGRNLLIQEGGRLMARNLANTTRNAQGSIRLQASDSIIVQGGFPFPGSGCTIEFCNSLVSTTTLAPGRGGDIQLQAPTIRLLDGGQVGLGSRGRGAGDSGKLTIQGEEIELRGVKQIFYAGIFSSVTNGASGTGGNVEINANRLRILDGGSISVASSSSFGSTRAGENLAAVGSAGSIKINASDLVELSGSAPTSTGGILRSSLRADVSSDARGAGGRIEIKTNQLWVTNGANITTTTAAAQATSGAGNIDITARSMLMRDGGSLQASSRSGSEGNIKITSDLVLLRRQSDITTISTGNSNGGNVAIDSPLLIGLDNSNIIANAGTGRGGNIGITTQALIGLAVRNTLTPLTDPTNDITASSASNLNGTVQINTIGIDPNAGLIALPGDLIDPTQQIAAGCQDSQGSRFIVTGRGGVPTTPENHLPIHNRAWTDLREMSQRQTQSIAQAPQAPQTQGLVEATQWQKHTATGKVELMAPQPVIANSAVTCATAQ